MKKQTSGFTLLELMVVVAILATLALIVFVSLDPATQFAEARNDRRWSDVNNITSGMYRYIITNDGFPEGLDEKERQLGTASFGCNEVCTSAQESCLDLSEELEPYVTTIPKDPQGGLNDTTFYSIVKNSDNVITVKACKAENDVVVQISR